MLLNNKNERDNIFYFFSFFNNNVLKNNNNKKLKIKLYFSNLKNIRTFGDTNGFVFKTYILI